MENPKKSCSRVNVHSKLTVVSSSPTGPGKTHPLNALDHAMASHTLHIIFYYRVNPLVEGFDSDNLRVSLCELLCKYPTMTGRVGKRVGSSNWVVNCNDAGVRMLRASVGSTVEEWLRTADSDEERELAVWEDMPAAGDDGDDPAVAIWSPFQIQLNTFEGGGLAIGLSFSHMHADPTSAVLFLKSWTDLKQGKPIPHDPIFSLPSINSATRKPTSYYSTKFKLKSPATKMGTTTFRFSHYTLEKRLSKVLDKCPDATPFDFLVALFWTRIVELKLNRPTNENTYSICVGVDVRNLVQIPHYFGNALNFSLLSVEKDVLKSCKLEDVAVDVHNHVSGTGKGDFWSNMSWLESMKDENGKNGPPFQMYGPELTCVSMEHVGVFHTLVAPLGPTEHMMIGNDDGSSLMYAAEFENDEKPVHVSCRVGNVRGEGLIIVMPSPEKGLARTVTVTLPEEVMGRLCEDQAILELEPTMIISGRS